VRARRRWRVTRSKAGIVGLVLLAFVVAVALLGPLVAPHSIDAPIGAPAEGPRPGALLGTDTLGRDVLSRVLHGGFSVLWLSVVATVLTYLVGGAIGLAAGYTRSLVDPVLMRSMDLLLAFPALLLLLILITGAGQGMGVLILGIVLVLTPGVARLVRTATLEVAVSGYVEAAVARGERGPAIALREILPNIAGSISADLGIRYSYAIILVASVNFLGLGQRPPAANWGLMLSENREIITVNVWSTVAPALLLAILTVAVNLVGDAYTRELGRS
jgi:peptide/nickel transport system permease protein